MIQLVPLFRGPQPSGRGPVLVPWQVRNWTAQQEVSGSEGRGSELVKLRLLLLIAGIPEPHHLPVHGKIVFWSLVPKRLGTVVLVGLSLELLLRLYWSDENLGILPKCRAQWILNGACGSVTLAGPQVVLMLGPHFE